MQIYRIHVNDYNGNLILEHATLAMGGSRMPVSLSHIYNTNDRTTDLGYGYGFRLNYHQTLKKVNISGTEYYQYVDRDGTVHYFYYDEDKSQWKDESGLELTFTVNTGSAEAYYLKDKEDNEMMFNTQGYLRRIKDRNGNRLIIAYSNARVSQLTDGAGRITTLTYATDTADGISRLSKITTPSGQTKTFAYTSGRLTSITDIDGSVLTYTYNGSNLLTSVKNVDNYQVKVEYYNLNPYRVKKLTEYGGAVQGNSLTITYGNNSTKYTDQKGRSEIYRFNNSGNLLHINDGFGHAASGRYNRDGNHVNRLENETKLQDNIIQLLKDPIIQAKTLGWESQVSDAATTTASINTNTDYVKVGTRSLRL